LPESRFGFCQQKKFEIMPTKSPEDPDDPKPLKEDRRLGLKIALEYLANEASRLGLRHVATALNRTVLILERQQANNKDQDKRDKDSK
jgi:hypothetical protein